MAKLVAEAAAYQPGQSREPFRRLEELASQPSGGARKQLEAGLVRLLSPGSSYEAKEFACTQLGILGSKTALPALSALLTNNETAGIACLALTTYPPGKADEVLRAALPSARGSARVQIIDTLGDRRDAQAVKLLAPLGTDTDGAVAGAAIAALGKIGDAFAWKAITALPSDLAPALQAARTEAILRYAEARAVAGDGKGAGALYEDLLAVSQPVSVRRAALDALLRLNRGEAQARILQVMHGSDSALKPVAIANVRALTSTNASEVFAAELPKLTPQEQVWMIDSLAARGDATASAAIGNSLGSPEPAVRRAAISALGRMGDAWCVPLFAHTLDHSKDAEERRALESALVSLPGGAQTDVAIADTLKKSSGQTRATLITAIALRQGPVANKLLLSEAGQTNPVVAIAAFRALTKTASELELTPLLERLTSTRDAEVRAEAADAARQAILRSSRASRCSSIVRNALGWAQSVDSRVVVLGLLPACGDAVALTAAKFAATEPDFRIRDAAVAALSDWPDASAWDTLVGIYRRPSSETVRGFALRGLVRLVGEENAHPSPELVEHYRLLLQGAHSDADFRLILGALGGAADPGALQLALPLLDNSSVRAEAEVAVKKIAEAIKGRNPKTAQEAMARLKTGQ